MLGIKITAYYLRRGQSCCYLCYFCGAEILFCFTGQELGCWDGVLCLELWQHPGIHKDIFDALCGMFRGCSCQQTGRRRWALVAFCNFLRFMEPSLPLVYVRAVPLGPWYAVDIAMEKHSWTIHDPSCAYKWALRWCSGWGWMLHKGSSSFSNDFFLCGVREWSESHQDGHLTPLCLRPWTDFCAVQFNMLLFL